MGVREYASSSLFDFLLCFISSSALAYTVCSAFYSTHLLKDPPFIIIGICLVMTLALFAAAYDRRTLLFGSIGIAVAVVIAVIAAMRMSSVASVLEDAEGNYAMFLMLVILPTLLVFLMSRKRVSCVILVFLGVLIGALIEYLYWNESVIAFAVFAVSAAALFVVRNYHDSLLISESDRLSFASVGVAGVVLMLISMLAASCLFLVVVQPLNPPNVIIKLITKHVKIEEVHVRGTGSSVNVENDTLSSSNLSQDIVYTNQAENTDSNQQNNDSSNTNNSTQNNAGSALSLDSRGDNDAGSPVTFEVPDWFPFVIAGVILLLIAAVLVGKKLLRRRRYRLMTTGSNALQIQMLYQFFISRFSKMKIPEPENLTLREYAYSQGETFTRFESKSDVPKFTELTEIYNKSAFGNAPVSDEECSLFKRYYEKFYKNTRGFVGTLKYCLLYFFV